MSYAMSDTTSYTMSSCRKIHNIIYNIAYDIAYDIVSRYIVYDVAYDIIYDIVSRYIVYDIVYDIVSQYILYDVAYDIVYNLSYEYRTSMDVVRVSYNSSGVALASDEARRVDWCQSFGRTADSRQD